MPAKLMILDIINGQNSIGTPRYCIILSSPIAIRCLKSAFNAAIDGQAGIQELAGNATLLYYMSEEGQEGKNAYIEKRKPNFRKYPWLP